MAIYIATKDILASPGQLALVLKVGVCRRGRERELGSQYTWRIDIIFIREPTCTNITATFIVQ